MNLPRTQLRILAVSGRPPLPATDGDNLANLGLLSALTTWHTLTLLTVDRTDSSASGREQLEALVGGRLVILDRGSPQRDSTSAAIGRLYRGITTGTPARYLSRLHSDFPSMLASLAREHDCVVFLDNYFAHYAHYSTAPTVLHLHNVDGWSAASERPKAHLARCLQILSVRQIRSVEGDAVRRVEAVTVTSEEERQRLFQLYQVKARAVVPSGVAIPQTVVREPRKKVVAWLGSHSYGPNVAGLRRFLAESWPGVVGRTGAEFWIGGRNPPPDIARLHGMGGVRVLGFVEDPGKLFAQVSVGVVPLWHGAGVKLKTITMMAYMVPVVTTPVGAEGIDLTRLPLLIAEEPWQMTQAIVNLLENEPAAELLGARGREVAASEFSWEAVGRQMDVVIRTLVPASSGSG